jgi:La-related protein 7
MNSDSLKKYFEQFGKISYISLPKFKSSDQSRGFGFIEFNEKESAKKAVEVKVSFFLNIFRLIT